MFSVRYPTNWHPLVWEIDDPCSFMYGWHFLGFRGVSRWTIGFPPGCAIYPDDFLYGFFYFAYRVLFTLSHILWCKCACLEFYLLQGFSSAFYLFCYCVRVPFREAVHGRNMRGAHTALRCERWVD